jgi:hypothetical protein
MKAHTRFGLRTSAGAVVTAAAVTLAPMAAFAAPAPAQTLKVSKLGKLSAHGAAVQVPVAYACQSGWEGNVGIQLVEARGNALATGYGNKSTKCTGELQKVVIYLQANSYQASMPFAAGDASAVVTLDSYDPAAQGCSDGMPCPAQAPEAKPAPAAPPTGAITNASMTQPAKGQGHDPSNAHSQFEGTITLVK